MQVLLAHQNGTFEVLSEVELQKLVNSPDPSIADKYLRAEYVCLSGRKDLLSDGALKVWEAVRRYGYTTRAFYCGKGSMNQTWPLRSTKT